ncbi:MAG: endonuclease MutS2 [Treponema sp.]|nr:endonuclease MutS2 [Treponema sp.]
MNEKTLKLLEFDAIRFSVSELALSAEAARAILEEEPLLDREGAKRQKSLVSAITERMTYLAEEKRESLPEIGQLFPKLAVEGMLLETDEVYALGLFIRRAETLRQWLQKPYGSDGQEDPGKSSAEDVLAEIAGPLPACQEAAAEIFKIIDNEGNLRDLPELREIKKRIRALQKEIESAGSRYAKNEETRRMLQSELPSQRDGRMVLAVKANFRGRIRGIVHELSSTGQTIFVEPEEVVEKNNELLIENRRLEAEIRRILRELSRRIALHLEDMEQLHCGIIFLEGIRARARYGFEKKFVFAENSEKLSLKAARHPLLGSRAVPLDLSMEDGIRTVIITGPNTGGKTVALKTLGLLSMMNQFGLALPIQEGSLPLFDGIYADIGDEQSLSQSLSTFSGHMSNIADIIRRSTEASLVLLDELGAGTDPEEGSAIAMAILDHFIEKKTRLIITTHHGILKNYGYSREGVENASMEFDSQTLSPTYKIAMGIPGESRALEIAARHGLGAELLRQARAYLDSELADVSALISGLKDKHRQLDAAAQAGKKEEKRLLEERRRSDLKELRLRQKELQLRSDGLGSLNKLLGESRKTLENLVREVKESSPENLSRDKTLKVKEFLAGLEERVQAEKAAIEREGQVLAEESRRFEAEGYEAGQPDEKMAGKEKALKPGTEVLAGESRKPGRILRRDRKASGPGRWVVEIGSLKMSFSEAELVPLAGNGNKGRGGGSTAWAAELSEGAAATVELKLRGLRLNEALEALGRQLDAAALAGLHGFAVIHGLGDGILSKGVHELLKKDPRVADYYFSRPEQGGFGRTEVIMKG